MPLQAGACLYLTLPTGDRVGYTLCHWLLSSDGLTRDAPACKPTPVLAMRVVGRRRAHGPAGGLL